MKEHIIVTEDVVQRLDAYLASVLGGISRAKIQKLIESGNILVNARKTDKKYILKSGDEVDIEFQEQIKPSICAQDIAIEIIYEDEDIAIINKPKHMVVHIDENHNEGTLVNAIMHHFANLSDVGGVDRLGIVHRLDKDTSGIMLIAKTNFAYENLKEQFQSRTVFKKYLAIVYGGFSQPQGVIDFPIGRHPKNRLLREVYGENARTAITKYNVLEQNSKVSLVECILETGRTHQIRVHMKHIKHPIYGDNFYGIKSDKADVNGQHLHSKVIGFNHVRTNQYMEFSASVPEYFIQALQYLNLKWRDL